MGIEEKLGNIVMGSLPKPPAPAGLYAPVSVVGNLAFVSGQIPMSDGKIQYTGKVSDENMADARDSARLCAINVLAQLKSELGTLEKVKKIARVTGYVNSEPGFIKQPKVIDGASEVFKAAFDAPHSRAAVGVASLPLGVMTEVDAIAEIC